VESEPPPCQDELDGGATQIRRAGSTRGGWGTALSRGGARPDGGGWGAAVEAELAACAWELEAAGGGPSREELPRVSEGDEYGLVNG
jgi:hypothetical protein